MNGHAVMYAYAYPIYAVHRDVKPHNVLLMLQCPDEQCNIRAKITDFGISKEASDESASLSIEQWHSSI